MSQSYLTHLTCDRNRIIGYSSTGLQNPVVSDQTRLDVGCRRRRGFFVTVLSCVSHFYVVFFFVECGKTKNPADLCRRAGFENLVLLKNSETTCSPPRLNVRIYNSIP